MEVARTRRRTLQEMALATLGFLAVLVSIRAGISPSLFGQAVWPEILLATAAFLSTAAWMGERLPTQNVALALPVIGGLAMLVQGLASAVTGKAMSPGGSGIEMIARLPWTTALAQTIGIANAQGVARLMLYPCRRRADFGWRLLCLSGILAALFNLGLQTLAAAGWGWRPGLSWQGPPWVELLACGIAAAVILALAAPLLIVKKPVEPPILLAPLGIWLLLSLVFVANAFAHRLWLPAATLLLSGGAIALAALRGVRVPKNANAESRP